MQPISYSPSQAVISFLNDGTVLSSLTFIAQKVMKFLLYLQSEGSLSLNQARVISIKGLEFCCEGFKVIRNLQKLVLTIFKGYPLILNYLYSKNDSLEKSSSLSPLAIEQNEEDLLILAIKAFVKMVVQLIGFLGFLVNAKIVEVSQAVKTVVKGIYHVAWLFLSMLHLGPYFEGKEKEEETSAPNTSKKIDKKTSIESSFLDTKTIKKILSFIVAILSLTLFCAQVWNWGFNKALLEAVIQIGLLVTHILGIYIKYNNLSPNQPSQA